MIFVDKICDVLGTKPFQYLLKHLEHNFIQMAGSEGEWLEKQIESEKSISALEQQIRTLKVCTICIVTEDVMK